MRGIVAIAGMLLATAGVVGAVAVWAAPGEQAGPTLNLIAGQGAGVISMNGFVADPALGAPNQAVRVAVGTTVTWTVDSDEPHLITFLAGRPRPGIIIPQPEDPIGLLPMANPDVFFPMPAMGPWDGTTYVNSSPLGRGQQFSVTFSKAGTYPYECIFHVQQGMAGRVEVVAPGSAGITTQAAVDGLAATHMAAVHQSQIDTIMATRNQAAKLDNPNGTSTWFARAGTDWRYGHLDVLAFLPDTLTVWQGDTVVWFNDHPYAPHTVTFLSGGPHPEEFVVTLPDGTVLSMEEMMMMPPPDPSMSPPDPSMMPRLVVGPGLLSSPTGPVYSGKGFFNSGILGDFNPVGMNTHALTFDTPGEYPYICVLHHAQGMVGTITVLPR